MAVSQVVKNQLKLTFDGEFEADLVTSKRFFRAPCRIDVAGSEISVDFGREVKITDAYIVYISAFLRNYCAITGQIRAFSHSNLSAQIDAMIKEQTLLYTSVPRIFKAQVGADKFFERYVFHKKRDREAKCKRFDTFNAVVPWLLLLEQENFFVQKLRITFTILEMFAHHFYNISKPEKCYVNFIQTSDESVKMRIRNFISEFPAVMKAPSASDDRKIQTLYEAFGRNLRGQNGDRLRIFGHLICQIRNKNFHGNLSPIVKVNSENFAHLQAIYGILRDEIYNKFQRLINEICD